MEEKVGEFSEITETEKLLKHEFGSVVSVTCVFMALWYTSYLSLIQEIVGSGFTLLTKNVLQILKIPQNSFRENSIVFGQLCS